MTAREYLQEYAALRATTLHAILREGFRVRVESVGELGWSVCREGEAGALSIPEILGQSSQAHPLPPFLVGHVTDQSGIFVHPDGSTENVPCPSPGGSVSPLVLTTTEAIGRQSQGGEQPGEGRAIETQRADWGLIFDAWLDGAREGQRSPDAPPELLSKGSDAYCKLLQERMATSCGEADDRDIPCRYRFGCDYPALCLAKGACG